MLIRYQQQVPQICKSPTRSISFCFLLISALAFTPVSLAYHQGVVAPTKDAPAAGWTLGEDSWNYWWSYSGVSGPSYWGLFNLDWFICDKGRRQSPINIDTSALVYDAHLAPLRVVDNNLLISGILYNDGHSIVFNGSSALSRFTTTAGSGGAAALPSEDTKQPMDKDNNAVSAVAAAADAGESNAGDSKNVSRRSVVGVSGEPDLVAIEKGDRVYSLDVFPDGDDNGPSLQQTDRDWPPGVELLMRATGLTGSETDLASATGLTGGDRLVESAPMLVNGDASDQDDSELTSGASGNTLNAIDSLAGPREALADEADTDAAAAAAATSLSQSVHFTGAGLAYSYKFEALNLRFGQQQLNQQVSSSTGHHHWGSEHRINSRSFAGELQLLAYNWQLYKSYQEASTRPYGLLGIAILIDLLPGPSTGDSGATKSHYQNRATAESTTRHNGTNSMGRSLNEQLERLLSQLGSVSFRGQYQPIEGLNLTALLPDTDQFVTYEGSLTQPGCHESVTWLLLNRPLYIAKQSLDKLRSISADEQSGPSFSGTPLAGNIRPVQSINNRPIRTNIRPPSSNQAGDRSDKPDAATCPRLWTKYEYLQAAS